MLTPLKTLLERFANSTSFDDLFDAINQIYRDADADHELKGWFTDMDRYIRKCLQEQGYILEDVSNQEWNQLYDRGNYLLRDKYRNHTDRIADELKFLAGQFDEDSQNRAFAEAMNKVSTVPILDTAGQNKASQALLHKLLAQSSIRDVRLLLVLWNRCSALDSDWLCFATVFISQCLC
jgi:hypothetical protein